MVHKKHLQPNGIKNALDENFAIPLGFECFNDHVNLCSVHKVATYKIRDTFRKYDVIFEKNYEAKIGLTKCLRTINSINQGKINNYQVLSEVKEH